MSWQRVHFSQHKEGSVLDNHIRRRIDANRMRNARESRVIHHLESRPTWDSSNHDLSSMRLTDEQLALRREQRCRSKHNALQRSRATAAHETIFQLASVEEKPRPAPTPHVAIQDAASIAVETAAVAPETVAAAAAAVHQTNVEVVEPAPTPRTAMANAAHAAIQDAALAAVENMEERMDMSFRVLQGKLSQLESVDVAAAAAAAAAATAAATAVSAAPAAPANDVNALTEHLIATCDRLASHLSSSEARLESEKAARERAEQSNARLEARLKAIEAQLSFTEERAAAAYAPTSTISPPPSAPSVAWGVAPAPQHESRQDDLLPHPTAFRSATATSRISFDAPPALRRAIPAWTPLDLAEDEVAPLAPSPLPDMFAASNAFATIAPELMQPHPAAAATAPLPRPRPRHPNPQRAATTATAVHAAPAAAAPKWVKRMSRSTGKAYWLNSLTGETMWTLPDSEDAKKVALAGESRNPLQPLHQCAQPPSQQFKPVRAR